MATALEVAQWMAEKLEKEGSLLHEDIAQEIDGLFGSGFVEQTERGVLSISSTVRRHFQRLTGAEWNPGERGWWKR
jgi:hypothetical protein